MTNIDQFPLGFADLTQDEILLVSIFRSWFSNGPEHTLCEKDLSHLLREDRIFSVLPQIFIYFRYFKHLRIITINNNELLSLSEVDLLTFLNSENQIPAIKQCRKKIIEHHIDIRPVSNIERSGLDYLQLRIAESYNKFMTCPL